MKNISFLKKAALLLAGVALVLASCRKDEKPEAGQGTVASVKFAKIVGDARDWGVAADWLDGSLSYLGAKDLKNKKKELFFNEAGTVIVPQGILVKESSYIYVTFVGENADFNNVLGYYYYPQADESSFTDADFLSQVFISAPEGVTFQNIVYATTRNLGFGDTFELGATDEDGNRKPFDAGTVVGFCLFPNAGGNSKLIDPDGTEIPAIKKTLDKRPIFITTNWSFNDGQVLSHTAGLSPCGDMVIAFEDLNSSYSNSSDDDFNDLVFALTDNLQERSATVLQFYGENVDIENPVVLGKECVEGGEIEAIQLSLDAVEIELGGEATTITITGGVAPYGIKLVSEIKRLANQDTLINSDIATIRLRKNVILIEGYEPGIMEIKVNDATGANVSLLIDVDGVIPLAFVSIPGQQPWKISKTEITNAQYCAFLNDWMKSYPNSDVPYSETDQYKPDSDTWFNYIEGLFDQHIEFVSGKWKAKPGKENYPMGWISWHGANAYCSYYGYFLPSVELWEYAAQGGEHFGYAGSNNIDDVAWYSENSDGHSHQVATKDKNGYNLYDMCGNLWEWTNTADIKGGAWNTPGITIDVTNGVDPRYRYATTGFRVCRYY